jgi:hypothetical protein
MLMHHADPGRQRGVRVSRRQRLAEHLYLSLVGGVVAEKDVHQRRLARAVFAKQRHHLAAFQRKRNGVIGDQRAKSLGDAREAENRLRLRAMISLHQLDLGSSSLISTTKEPSLIAASRSATSFIASSGTLPSKVPSGASEQPPSFMKE